MSTIVFWIPLDGMKSSGVVPSTQCCYKDIEIVVLQVTNAKHFLLFLIPSHCFMKMKILFMVIITTSQLKLFNNIMQISCCPFLLYFLILLSKNSLYGDKRQFSKFAMTFSSYTFYFTQF